MKKLSLLILILLISTFVEAQRTINWYRVTADTAQLNYNPSATLNTIKMSYYNINPITGEQYRHTGNGVWVQDSVFKVGTTEIDLTGNATDWAPEQFGAINANLTFYQKGISQTMITSLYPGIGATPSDNVDWAAWQMAIKMATTNGGSVKAKGGTYYLGARQLIIEKYAKGFQLDGNYAKLISTGDVSIISSPTPSGNGDANIIVERKFTIKNIYLQGTSTQIGIDLGPSYGAVYENIFGISLDEVIHLRFALRTTIENCFSTNCNRGWIVDKGNWSGANNSNSQSNHTTIRSCRYFGSGDVAIGIYAASGCVVEDCIIEGGSVRVGIDVDGNSSTVVKDITIRNTHFECQNGATEAFIKIRLGGGIATIDKVFGQYASILIDAGATSGYLNVVLSNVPYWVFKGGKAFNNAGGVSWVFLYNDNSLFTTSPSTTVPTWFNGTAVSLCGGSGCGSNRFFYTSIPR